MASEDDLESRMCPFCHGRMKLVRVDGHPKLSTCQCLSHKEVTALEDGAGIGSYFEWLMSRSKSKNASRIGRLRLRRRPAHLI